VIFSRRANRANPFVLNSLTSPPDTLHYNTIDYKNNGIQSNFVAFSGAKIGRTHMCTISDVHMFTVPPTDRTQSAPCPSSAGSSGAMSRSHSPQTSLVSGLAQAFAAHCGQVYLVLLAAFFLRVSSSAHSSI